MARTRAANVLDSQPPAVAVQLRPALGPLREAIAKLGESDRQARSPLERAVAAIEGSTRYYRWSDRPMGPKVHVRRRRRVHREAAVRATRPLSAWRGRW